MSSAFDAIVIGSGFGGAISACRLAEKGMKVLVLERGRRWSASEYPRKPGDAWLFNHRAPAQLNGWLDLRFFKHIAVSQAAGVGGGSLAYSSVALEANPNLFASSWPPEITPAPMPVAIFTNIRCSIVGHPVARSPSAMMLTSLSTSTGASKC